MATENPGWGYTRIRGALYDLGHDIGRNTIKRVLTDAGLEPAPERGRSPSWKTYLRAHWDAIAAVDFFAVEHHERERNHQGVGNRLLVAAPMNDHGPVKRRERLGGTLNFYYRQAA